MGTWGPGNLDSDAASDELGDRTHKLVESLLERARNKLSRDEGEYECAALFIDFEMVLALDAKKLLRCNNLPSSEEVEDLKKDYIREWAVHIDGYEPQPEYKKDRRQVILRTFNRFKKICSRREQENQESGNPDIEWVEIAPPTLEELTAGSTLSMHPVLGDYQIILPENWSTQSSKVLPATPTFLLTNHFVETDGRTFTAKALVLDDASEDHGKLAEHPFLLEEVFFATGRSTLPEEVPESADPYILVARLRSEEGAAPDLYDLVFGSGEALSPNYEGEGCFLYEGPCGKDTTGEMEFLGFYARKQTEYSSNKKLRLFQNMYFHVISKDSLILLEYGGLGEEPNSFSLSVLVGTLPDPNRTKYMADPALVEHLTATLSLKSAKD